MIANLILNIEGIPVVLEDCSVWSKGFLAGRSIDSFRPIFPTTLTLLEIAIWKTRNKISNLQLD
jgi:hypothetical protein